jgi:predicted aldo/keto reductase-like oxidoreductase
MSYVIINKETQKAVCEIFDPKILKHLNTEKYEAIQIMKYLCDLNEKIKNEREGL